MRNDRLTTGKSIIYNVTFGIALVCVMLFTGCDDVSGTPEIQRPAESGFGRISINFTDDETAEQAEPNKARTVLPSTVFDKYVYTFTRADETAGEEKTPDKDGFFTLEVGSYTVTVQAYLGEEEPYTLAANGISSEFTVESGNNDPVKVILTRVDAGTQQGTFSYTITYPSGAALGVSLQKWPGMEDVALSPVNVPQGNGKTQSLQLDAGSYLLTVFVSRTGLYAGISEAVQIEPLLTTAYIKNYGNDDFISKRPGAAVSAPVFSSATSNSITINAVDQSGNGQAVEYGISTSGTPSAWQTSLTFNGLNSGTQYYIYARSAEDNDYASGAARYINVRIVTVYSEWSNALSSIRNSSGTPGNPRTYTIAAIGSFSITGSTAAGTSLGSAEYVEVTLKGSGTISLNSSGSILRLDSNQTLVIDDENLILQGRTGNSYPVLYVQNGGALELINGTVRGNTSNSGGGGVLVSGGGFTMSGGTISGNTVSGSANGGGVNLSGGSFTMSGGAISGNTAYRGGGLYVYSGSFTMTGGTIYGSSAGAPLANTATNSGAALYVESGTAKYGDDVNILPHTDAQSLYTNNTITPGEDGGNPRAPGEAVSAPTGASTITTNSITINPVTAPTNGQIVEYARNTENTPPETGWQTSTTFSGLVSGTTYYFFARSAQNANYNAGPPSSGYPVTTPSYSISLNPSGTYTFTSASYGYGTQTAQIITINNTGNQATGALTAALSGISAGNFTLSTTSISSIAAGGNNSSLTVRPNTGLGAGTYTASVNITGGNSISASLSVSFTVNKANGAAVSAPSGTSSISDSSITINPVTAPTNGQTIEYARNTANTAPGTGWQPGTTFSGLGSGTNYYFFARSAQDANYNAGTASSGYLVKTTGFQDGSGSGIQTDPFVVGSLTTLQKVGTGTDGWTLSACYRQEADITVTGNWTPIGSSSSSSFTGSYNGNEKTITGLTINSSADYQGMFGYIGTGGAVSNLALTNISISGGNNSGDDYVGGVAGYNSGTIENCYVNGNVYGNMNSVGGIAGYISGTVKNCYTIGSVSGTSYVGGVVGYNYYGTVENCYSTASVTGRVSTSNYVGGIVGYIYMTSIVRNCVALNESVTISGSNIGIGRVVGINSSYSSESNNYAWVGMRSYINGSIEAPSNTYTGGKDGASLTAPTLMKVQNTWETAGLVFISPYPWKWTSGKMPHLFSNDVQDWPSYIVELGIGSGATSDPYLVRNLAELTYVGKGVLNPAGYRDWTLSVHYKMDTDISLSGNWTPIGDSSLRFTGTFNGNGKTISGLTIASSADYQGMFGYIDASGAVSNLALTNVNISGGNNSGDDYVGGIAGYSSGTVENCFVSGSVLGLGDSVGGIAGYVSGTVKNCYTIGSVSGTRYVGGVVGYNYYCTVENCYSAASVTGRVGTSNYVGGIVGYIHMTSIVRNCVALNESVTISGSNTGIGRVVGINSDYSSESNNYAWIDIPLKINGSSVVASNTYTGGKDGASLTATQVKTQTAWETAGFVFNSSSYPWTWASGWMPYLYINNRQTWPSFLN